jgi:hypothetical protein
VERSWRAWCATGAVAVASATLVAGCGGGERQDANEPSGTFRVAVLRASFPKNQALSKKATMRVVVRNAGRQTIPNIAVTISSGEAAGGGGFQTHSDAAGLADSSRPLWIVDSEPHGGSTAYVSTWALGPLPAGRTRVFTWRVTPMVAGSHTLRYRVAAGLNGKAKAQLDGGGEAGGTWRVNVSGVPPKTTVDPGTGDVVKQQ